MNATIKTVLGGLGLLLAMGCGGNAGMPEGTTESPDVTQACCTISGTATCASAAVAVQWLDRYWTTNPAEDDAGACQTGQSCSAYQIVDGGLEPIGNGTCE